MDATLVVMAAGMGSRFGGLKQVEPVGPAGQAMIDFSVYDAAAAGFNKVVFVIKHAIEAEFKELVGKRLEKVIDVEYVFQETDNLPSGFVCPEERVKPWGTGHAVLCCKDIVKTPFAVINADDFYGKHAYRQVIEQLKDNNYCMVGFKLQNTVTDNGYVSRGVCVTEDGFLKGVTEHTKINGNCVCVTENGETKLSPDTVVSMNFWGFTPDIFEHLEKGFKEFLEKNINAEKAEFYLPAVVDELIKSGKKQVKVAVAEDKWYGVTYKEDKENVTREIGKMVDAGLYEGM